MEIQLPLFYHFQFPAIENFSFPLLKIMFEFLDEEELSTANFVILYTCEAKMLGFHVYTHSIFDRDFASKN